MLVLETEPNIEEESSERKEDLIYLNSTVDRLQNEFTVEPRLGDTIKVKLHKSIAELMSLSPNENVLVLFSSDLRCPSPDIPLSVFIVLQ